MAQIARALRPLRRELNNSRNAKPEIQAEFETSAARTTHIQQLKAYHKTLSLRKDSFEKVQREYLNAQWNTDADQKTAEQQVEADAELLVVVDKNLAEISSAIDNLVLEQTEEKEKAAQARQHTVVQQAAQHPQLTAVTRLPKLAFPSFDGNILQWQNFWDRFRVTVHENQTLTAVDKMSFLVGQLKSEAANTVTGLAITEANYIAAVNMLKERYGNTEIIIDSHYTALTELLPASRPKELRLVVDQLEQHLNALHALGEDVNHRQFFTLIKSKLPSSTLLQLERERRQEEEEWNVDRLRERLRDYLQTYETAYQKQSQKSNEKFSGTSQAPVSINPRTSSTPKKAKTLAPHTTSALLSQPQKKDQNRPFKPHQFQNKSDQSQVQTSLLQCPYCDKLGHYADECKVITTASARMQKLKEKRLCFNCLGPNHRLNQCQRNKPCYICKKLKHHTSICIVGHPEKTSASMVATDPLTYQAAAQEAPTSIVPKGEHQMLAPNEISLLQTATVTFMGADEKTVVTAHGVLDNGSQRSYISEKLADQLKLRIIGTGKLPVFTFGSVQAKDITTKVTKVTMNLCNGKKFSFGVNVIPTITGNIQTAQVNAVKFHKFFSQLPMADQIPIQPENVEINFLIGADYFWDLITGEKIALEDGLYLISSSLGWLLGGRQPERQKDSKTAANLATTALYTGSMNDIEFLSSIDHKQTKDLSFMWDLETLGIKEKPEEPGDEEALCKFNDTVIFQDGCYLVTWPWKADEVDLPSNYHLALGRLNSLIKKYKNQPEIFQQYQQVLEDQQMKGIIEKVEDSSLSIMQQHYIPHFAVVTPGHTTNLRIVYDASAKVNAKSNSLNDCLYRGPVILDDIMKILIRFRLNPIAICLDIEKAFLQVGLQPAERDVTRFLWLKDPENLTTENNIQIYHFARVPFGVTSSPFLLGVTIQYHLRKNGSEVAMNILRNIYVDNIITGIETPDKAIHFYSSTKQLFKAASMNVCEWITNSQELLQHIPEDDCSTNKPKILGIPWDPIKDTISINSPRPFDSKEEITKRIILHYLASFFDPMGFLCPSILQGKLVLHKLWKNKFDWDESLPEPLTHEWIQIINNLSLVSSFEIPRFCGNGQSYELHCFADASQLAYGICIYLHIYNDGNISTQFIFGKSRLAPVHNAITIPHLELMAVDMGSKCLQFISNALLFTVSRQVIWTDSQCVLHWLDSEKPLSVFVRNRIKKIKELANVEYHYINTNQNPADCASRSLPMSELINSSL